MQMAMSLWVATVRRQSDICVVEECGWSYMEKIIFLIAAVLIYINLPKIFSYFYQDFDSCMCEDCNVTELPSGS